MKHLKLSLLASVWLVLGSACGGTDDAATCDDGVQNGDETAVDCGGACNACAPVCGDGDQAADEECDDGDTTAGDGCDAMCRLEFHEDFEGDTGAWVLTGSVIEAFPATSSNALHLATTNGACGSSLGTLSVQVPPSAAALRFDLAGNVPAGGVNYQMWVTLGGHLALPPLPLPAAMRQEAWCIPAAFLGTAQDLEFVVRTQNACDVIEAWIDNISIDADATACEPMAIPD